MPFGTAPRVCIGQRFTMLGMGLIAAMLMQRFRLEWPEGATWPNGDLAVTLRPTQPIRLNLHQRAVSPLSARLSPLLVMPPTGNHGQLHIVHGIDQSVHIIDAT